MGSWSLRAGVEGGEWVLCSRPVAWWEDGLRALGPLLPLKPLGARTLALLPVLPHGLFQLSLFQHQPQDTKSRI